MTTDPVFSGLGSFDTRPLAAPGYGRHGHAPGYGDTDEERAEWWARWRETHGD